jgi:hypothetical protein
MGGICRSQAVDHKYIHYITELKEETKTLLGRSRRRQEDNIKINVREIRRGFVQRIQLAHGGSSVEFCEICTEASDSVNVMNSFTSSEIINLKERSSTLKLVN